MGVTEGAELERDRLLSSYLPCEELSSRQQLILQIHLMVRQHIVRGTLRFVLRFGITLSRKSYRAISLYYKPGSFPGFVKASSSLKCGWFFFFFGQTAEEPNIYFMIHSTHSSPDFLCLKRWPGNLLSMGALRDFIKASINNLLWCRPASLQRIPWCRNGSSTHGSASALFFLGFDTHIPRLSPFRQLCSTVGFGPYITVTCDAKPEGHPPILHFSFCFLASQDS